MPQAEHKQLVGRTKADIRIRGGGGLPAFSGYLERSNRTSQQAHGLLVPCTIHVNYRVHVVTPLKQVNNKQSLLCFEYACDFSTCALLFLNYQIKKSENRYVNYSHKSVMYF